jgi:hypothetical protein
MAQLAIQCDTKSTAFAALLTSGTPVDAKYEPDYGDSGGVCGSDIFVDVPKSNLPAT